MGADAMSDWVKCSERKPTDDTWKWVTIAGSDLIPTLFVRYITVAQYIAHTKIWFGTDGNALVKQPVAWMDIDFPEVYRGGK